MSTENWWNFSNDMVNSFYKLLANLYFNNILIFNSIS